MPTKNMWQNVVASETAREYFLRKSRNLILEVEWDPGDTVSYSHAVCWQELAEWQCVHMKLSYNRVCVGRNWQSCQWGRSSTLVGYVQLGLSAKNLLRSICTYLILIICLIITRNQKTSRQRQYSACTTYHHHGFSSTAFPVLSKKWQHKYIVVPLGSLNFCEKMPFQR